MKENIMHVYKYFSLAVIFERKKLFSIKANTNFRREVGGDKAEVKG